MSSVTSSTAVKSMTGFAKIGGNLELVDLDVEVRSVNHRFLEVVFKGPRHLNLIERDLRRIIQGHHKRGRIEVSLSRRIRSVKSSKVVADELIDSVIARYIATCKRYGVTGDGLAHFIGAIILGDNESSSEIGEVDVEELNLLKGLVEQASSALCIARESEGSGLVKDIIERLGQLDLIKTKVAEQMQSAPEILKRRLLERISELSPEVQIDPHRLAVEVALLADRVDISEEIARLEIHLNQFRLIIDDGHTDGVGRKLDFTTQEIGRELNTIGSKCQNAFVQGIVVEAKAELERIREQVQNIE